MMSQQQQQHQQHQHGKVIEEKHTVPASLPSTAPPTPLQAFLPSPSDFSCHFERGTSGTSTLHDSHLSPCGSDSEAEHLEEDPSMSLPAELVKASRAPKAHIVEETLVQKMAREQLDAAQHPSAEAVCVGLPPMQSELGKWAKALVEAEEWLDRQIPRKFYVYNQEMRIWSDVLAFRCSRHEDDKDDTIEGVPWGSTIIGFDDGNGWVHVPGSGYLPKVLEGMTVLVTGVTDGPALTEDGLALDMDEGAPVFFASSRDAASSTQEADIAKRACRAMHAVTTARAAKDAAAAIDDEEVSALSATGVLYGALPFANPRSSCRVDKLKAIYRRKAAASRSALHLESDSTAWPQKPRASLCVSDHGFVFLHLHYYNPNVAKRLHVETQRHLAAIGTHSDVLLAVDTMGKVQIVEETLDSEQLDSATQPSTEAVCMGLPPMQSELGQWAKALVEAEEWLDRQIPKKFFVYNQEMRVWSDVLAYRCSRHEDDKDDTIEGVAWGSTIIGFDDGNGWVHVPGRGYLPKILEEKTVLVIGVTDGPALTEDGLAVDMDAGAPVFFACSRDAAASTQEADIAKRACRAMHAVTSARAAKDAGEAIDDEEVSALSSTGVLYGALPFAIPRTSCRAEKLKAIHRRKIAASRHAFHLTSDSTAWPQKPRASLCVSDHGFVFLHLHYYTPNVAKRLHVETQRHLAAMGVHSEVVLAVDMMGKVQDL